MNEARLVMLLDTFEELGELTRYFREDFLPRLDGHVKIVIAGRLPLGRMWTEGSPLSPLVQPMPLHAFSPAESRGYLMRRGLREMALVKQVASTSGGNPLALSLAADMVMQLGARDFSTAPERRLIVHSLVERLLQNIKDPRLLELLDVCAVVRHFDEATLSAVSGHGDIAAEFRQLYQLSAIRLVEHGLALHDDVRCALAEDLRWRHPGRFHALRSRALEYYRERMRTAPEAERQWLLTERLFLWENGLVQTLLFGQHEPGQVWIEPGRTADHKDIVRLWSYV